MIRVIQICVIGSFTNYYILTNSVRIYMYVLTCRSSFKCVFGSSHVVEVCKCNAMCFDHSHGLSHPSIRSTVKLITDRFLWQNSLSGIRHWAKHCLTCQTRKLHRQTVTTSGNFSLPDARFRHFHVNIVGPLRSSNRFAHLLTCVDRFTRWPRVVPLRDTSTESVSRAFVEAWIPV
ncbi:unnamed protein product [Dicrocoelium dendriticum]|nr:unnamed protein product [Dicrocoelium dendriticum]